jgi:hypothetical protein
VYLKHDNTVHYDSFQWNRAKSSVSINALFVCSVINIVMAHEIKWPDQQSRDEPSIRLPGFPGCIGLIDGTLGKIRRPFRNPEHCRWFNGRKRMNSMNSTVIVDHDGLFTRVDPGYPGSFHDVTILRSSDLYRNWREYLNISLTLMKDSNTY